MGVPALSLQIPNSSSQPKSSDFISALSASACVVETANTLTHSKTTLSDLTGCIFDCCVVCTPASAGALDLRKTEA